MTNQHTITSDVTFSDLSATYDDELAELREAYDDIVATAEDEYGDGAMQRPVPSMGDAPEDMVGLAVCQQQAAVIDETAKQIQNRQRVLETLADEYDGERFTLAMLTGSELVEIETQLRITADERGTNVQSLEIERQERVADVAVIDAPGGFPEDDDGSPLPSEAPNPLMLSLYEHVEMLNNAGEMGFRAPGFGGGDRGPAVASSATPTPTGGSSGGLPTSDAGE